MYLEMFSIFLVISMKVMVNSISSVDSVVMEGLKLFFMWFSILMGRVLMFGLVRNSDIGIWLKEVMKVRKKVVIIVFWILGSIISWKVWRCVVFSVMVVFLILICRLVRLEQIICIVQGVSSLMWLISRFRNIGVLISSMKWCNRFRFISMVGMISGDVSICLIIVMFGGGMCDIV